MLYAIDTAYSETVELKFLYKGKITTSHSLVAANSGSSVSPL